MDWGSGARDIANLVTVLGKKVEEKDLMKWGSREMCKKILNKFWHFLFFANTCGIFFIIMSVSFSLNVCTVYTTQSQFYNKKFN